MRNGRVIRVADLFCGGGGTSTGVMQACEASGARVDLVAVNHWDRAVETHAANHPGARHLCARIDALDPREICPRGLDLLVASPECTHFSPARGKAPVNDQSRASGWDVLRWVERLEPRAVLLENIPQWEGWGPLVTSGPRKGKPNLRRKGETFRAFVAALVSFGYRVEWRVLNCADYGDATTRRRLFVQARRGLEFIDWPQPSHLKDPTGTDAQRWRPAKDILDFSIESQSVFGREKPLCANTMQRIAEGLRRYASPAMAEAFLLHVTHGARLHSISEPLPTVTTAKRGEMALVQTKPYLVSLRGTEGGQIRSSARGLEHPIPTLTAGGGHQALVQPFVVKTSHKGGNGAYVRSVEDPLHTITTAQEEIGIATPFLLSQDGRGAPRRVSEPSPTIVGKGAVSLVTPFMVAYNGTGGALPITAPLPTATTRDRFGLVEPVQFDVLFRMLHRSELAAATSFPKGYVFKGTQEEIVKQIGNAVPIKVARALAAVALGLRRVA